MKEIVNKPARASDEKSVNKASIARQPVKSSIDRIMSLQRIVGNQVVQKLIRSGNPQLKLSEHSKEPGIRRKCPKCLNGGSLGTDDEKLQAKGDATPEVTSRVEANINALRGGGQPLPESIRAFFEPRFGFDFRNVRIHNDTTASRSAETINALAYTRQRCCLSPGLLRP